MALYDGVPSIRLEGDEQRALALVPEAKALLHRAQKFAKTAGVGTFSMHRVVEDGYIHVLCANGQNIISISVAAEVVDAVVEPSEPPEPTVRPDFYSGTISSQTMGYVDRPTPDGGSVKVPVCRSFAPTPDCIASHPKDGLVPGEQSVSRLGVFPHDSMKELDGPEGGYHQYGLLRSSMYSGMMAKVVQIVMGFGRLGKRKLMYGAPPEAATTPFVADAVASGVQIRFDYKFHRTHGITVAEDGRLWLVEISMVRGVLATPLRMYPKTHTKGFAEAAEKAGDDAMAFAVRELGALPTGESFPATSRGIEEGVAAGNILQLMPPSELREFYEFLGYSSAQGWAFSPDGREAHNTGWNYVGDDLIQTGVWYQINLKIGKSSPPRFPGDPIATGSASLRLVKKGWLYCSPRGFAWSKSRYLPFKSYEPLVDGLVSHQATPADDTGDNIPVSDTPVYVCFVNGSVRVVYYYHDPEYLTRDYERLDTGSCPYDGYWEVKQGERMLLPRMMYTNDLDPRREIQIGYRYETFESIDAGFTRPHGVLDGQISYHWIFGVRERRYYQTHTLATNLSSTVMGEVLVPRFSRSAFYYATADWDGPLTTDQEGAPATSLDEVVVTRHEEWTDTIRDPWVYALFQCLGRFDNETPQSGLPEPFRTAYPLRYSCRGGAGCGNTVDAQARVVYEMYMPNGSPGSVIPPAGGCYLYADDGPFMSRCETLPPYTPDGGVPIKPYRVWTESELARQDSGAYLFTDGHNGPISLPTTSKHVSEWWGAVSPDRYGDYQHISVSSSSIGEDAVVYDTAPNIDPTHMQKVYGYVPSPVRSAVYPTFVGVNIA